MAVKSSDLHRSANSQMSGSNETVKKANYYGGDDWMSDGGESFSIRSGSVTSDQAKDIDDKSYQSILHSHNFFSRSELDFFNKTYRFGVFNPYGTVTTAREFLFFTKPDLHILKRDDVTGSLVDGGMQEYLKSIPYWVDLYSSKKRIIKLLQQSVDDSDPFNHLLQNMVISNLEIPGLSAESIDTPSNMYGVSLSYRGSSEASDDSIDFSLEFKDTRWLDTYFFFKTYEEYQTLKHHGSIRPWKRYIENKVIHDQFAIYKFIVDEDMETILYWGKMYGVMPKSLPRDVFSNPNFDSGISYSVDFRAAFYEDMTPNIIYDFNDLSYNFYDSQPYQIDIHNTVLDRVDNRPAKAAFIEKVKSTISPNGYVYKLKWRGSDKI